MAFKSFLLLFFTGLISIQLSAQTPCSTLGQSPGSAFPVCGTDVFHQTTVPVCGGRPIAAPGCSGLVDMNPYWYHFTCFATGTLSFTINPRTSSDDYDWQLFDITGHDNTPEDVYTDPSLIVACNWSGQSGNTGASPSGTKLVTCGSTGAPYESAFSSMPTITQGHRYILMVSHFSGSDQSGYDLSFGSVNGGTASITDLTDPGVTSARAICDGIKMSIKLSKKMKCKSLKTDGSNFTITPAIAPIIAAEGVNCNSGFDMDSIVITLGSPIPPGNYVIALKAATDGTNIEDDCGRTISPTLSIPITVYPLIPTPMDSLTTPGCAPDVLQLVFRKPMQCNKVSPDGSEFVVTGGSTPITVISAAAVNCNADGVSSVIEVKLSAPIQTAGSYRITLKKGTDGDAIFDECGEESAVGNFINFFVADTVNAAFQYRVGLGCKADTITFSHDGRNAVNYWKWTFDNSINSAAKDSTLIYTTLGNKTAILIVSNGVCSDTSAVSTILLDNAADARFESTAVVCPTDPAIFKDLSINRIVAWKWDFGNGNTSTDQVPANQYYPAGNNNQITDIPVKLIVTNDIGCSDTTVKTIRVVGNCYIAIPKAFTPNGDGLNDYLYPTNAYKARELYFAVYNRDGNKIFETRDWTKKWDGTSNGNPQDPGTYAWLLQYTNIDTGKRIEQKGTTVLLR